MSDSAKAVFLSYAREDSAAAQRIAEALRSHGVEVWFDQNELRGGDAWDAKIRGQVKECALFIPIVSAHTQERHEGYFRLEWKLAVERTHLMLEGVPFLAPVVIDDTREAGAAMPAELLRVQWMRLPGALPTPQFVEQVKRMLEAPRKAKAQTEAGSSSPAIVKRPSIAAWALVTLGVLSLALGAYIFQRRSATPSSLPPSQTVAEPLVAPALRVPQVSDKSIAVLPFENMSEDKGNAYFCDGVQEDILTNLANISELRVVSRTSVEQYRTTTKPIREIARELGVAWILEGSVQRAGNKVRVTGQLINAATDEHKWAKAYDRDLSDIFAIQSELAQTIAASLQAELTPQEKALVDRRPTASLAAYDLLLKARQIRITGRVIPEERAEHQHLLEQAVQLDPNLVGAWANLSTSYSVYYLISIHTPEMLAKAHNALDIAKRLAPDDPTVMIAESNYYLNCFHDYTQARACLEAVAKRWPNKTIYGLMATVESHEGNWADALADYRRSVKMDPRTQTITLAEELCYARRYGEAAKVAREALAMSPDDLSMGYLAAYIAYIATGDPGPMTDWFGSVPAGRRSEMDFKRSQADWAWTRGDAAEYVRLRRAMAAPDNPPESEPEFVFALSVATSREQVRGLMEQVVSKNVQVLGSRGRAWGSQTQELAFLGQISAATDAFNSDVEDQKSRAVDQRYAGVYAGGRALQLAALGRKDEALVEVARMLSLPSAYWFSVTVLRHSLTWKDLQGDPRFEALLNDPKYKEPLF